MTRFSEQLSSEVDSAAIDAAWNAIGPKRLRARRVKRVKVAIPIVLGLLALLFFGVRGIGPAPTSGPLALASGGAMPLVFEASVAPTVSFDDGSRLEIHEGTRLSTKRADGNRVELALQRGGATFDIKPGGPRMWVVDAGDVTVRVLGTRFTVLRGASDDVRVVVERGKVLVENARLSGGSVILVAGQSVDVQGPSASPPAASSARLDAPDAKTPELAAALDEEPSTAGSALAVTTPAPGAAAVKAPAPSPKPRAAPSAPEEPPTILDPMASADEARHTGRPRDAVAILEKVVAQRDPQAALAAFTLGKIHADDLADPSTAGDWFERATTLGLPAALHEDASSRVVECYARAGRKADARAAAVRYRETFPQGRYLERVRAWASR